MSKSLDQQVHEWLEVQDNCDAANDFYEHSFLEIDLPDFREVADTRCRSNSTTLPTHRPHPTVQ